MIRSIAVVSSRTKYKIEPKFDFVFIEGWSIYKVAYIVMINRYNVCMKRSFVYLPIGV